MSAREIHPLARMPEEWSELLAARGERPFRGRQVFRWIHARGVTDPAQMTDLPAKLREEADEIEAALDAGARDDAAAEIGDLLFALVNLARHLDADPEAVLRATNAKFERRFAAIEGALAARGKTPKEATLAEMDALWDAAKAAEKS